MVDAGAMDMQILALPTMKMTHSNVCVTARTTPAAEIANIAAPVSSRKNGANRKITNDSFAKVNISFKKMSLQR